MTPVYYLMISALGLHRHNTISELSRVFLRSGCDLINSKVNIMGQELAGFFYLSGNWGAIAKLEAALPGLKKRLHLNLQTLRAQENSVQSPLITYNFQVVALDRKDTLNALAKFLQKLDISIEEINVQTYLTHTQTRMISMQLRMNIPTTAHIATLREKIMLYCDDNNLDGFIEPLRNH